MILRRLTEHVKSQNWFAVFLDFVIVVAGVFVGIQVSNWNAARELRASEMNHLAQLRDEIDSNIGLLDAQAAYTREVADSGRRALAFLESDGDCGKDCAGLLIDFFHASQLWGTPYSTAKYDENARLGFPSDEEAGANVELFYRNLAGWTAINLTAPAFRNTLRGYLSPDASRILWGDCFDVPEKTQLEILSRDCADEFAAGDAAATLRAIHADNAIANELRFWIGQNIFALEEYPGTRRIADRAIAALTDEIGDGK